jgi:phage-related protein
MQIILLDEVNIFLESVLNEREIAKTIHVIELLEEFGKTLGLPHSRYMDDGILELRIRGKREIRLLYCFYKNKAIVLHAFIKKTQNTPTKILDKARRIKSGLQ